MFKKHISEHLSLGIPRQMGKRAGKIMENKRRHRTELGIHKIHHIKKPISFSICR